MPSHDKDYLLQTDLRAELEGALAARPWLTVYKSWHDEDGNGGWFCALVPVAQLDKVLTYESWDLTAGRIGPGCTQYSEAGREVVEYFRFGDRDGVEPLVIPRTFSGIRAPYVELLEEFRLFHNAFHDRRTDTFISHDEAGNDRPIARIDADGTVHVERLALRQFLAMKEMVLVIQVDSVRGSALQQDDVPEHERTAEVSTAECRYRLDVARERGLSRDWNSFSRLLGKTVVRPLPREQSGMWPYDEEPEEYPEFIIGVDENERPIRFTCDHARLANYFGANPDAPHYLTPVHFRREVLGKYYADPDRYSVEDGYLWCGRLWGVRIDNDHEDHVIAFLGDLGRDLPARERGYWLSFNVAPEGPISRTAWTRGFRAEPAYPERPDLLFRYRYAALNERWQQVFGWPLFLALHGDDAHLIRTLRVPVTGTQSEADQQILALTKLCVDSLNERQLARGATDLAPEAKGIDKAASFLNRAGYAGADDAIHFLRDLQEIRSTGVAHRRGRRYESALARQGLSGLTPPAAVERLFVRAIGVLDGLGTLAMAPSDGE